MSDLKQRLFDQQKVGLKRWEKTNAGLTAMGFRRVSKPVEPLIGVLQSAEKTGIKRK